MLDPNHVLVRCPNGHELQASRDTLSERLACPVCGVHFTPGDALPPPSETPMNVAYAGAGGYAQPSIIKAPVEPPAYLTWLIVCALTWDVLNGISSIWTIVFPPAVGAGPSLGVYGFSCMIAVASISALVLHLMWMYRVHNDARRARLYSEIGPGLALGLSFIPWFNYAWMGWTTKKLAAFSAQQPGADASAGERVRNLAAWLFYFGIARCAFGCAGGILSGYLTFKIIPKAGAFKPGAAINPLEDAGSLTYGLLAMIALVNIVSVVYYAYAIPKFQAFLYSSLRPTPPAPPSGFGAS